MSAPETLEIGLSVHRLDYRLVTALGRAVLHQRDQRIKRASRRTARKIHAMTGDEKDIELSNLVDGT